MKTEKSIQKKLVHRIYSERYLLIMLVSFALSVFSIRIFRTIHPIVVGSSDPTAAGAFNMTADMRVAFFFSLFTFTLIYITLLWHRLRLQQLIEKIEERKLTALSS